MEDQKWIFCTFSYWIIIVILQGGGEGQRMKVEGLIMQMMRTLNHLICRMDEAGIIVIIGLINIVGIIKKRREENPEKDEN